ncbi:MAG: DNA gyrase inhibitor YacG [Alphaproteobacteria bacterium]|nr:DNA gyrase inhibitor YacG [Alphaproteobacteria bacterium]
MSARCPICGRPAEPRERPFCSRRCRDVDLGRWLSGAYAIPAATPPEDEDDPGADGLDTGRQSA